MKTKKYLLGIRLGEMRKFSSKEIYSIQIYLDEKIVKRADFRERLLKEIDQIIKEIMNA